jgi:hypothetical protein
MMSSYNGPIVTSKPIRPIWIVDGPGSSMSLLHLTFSMKETHYREFLLAHLFEICRREEEHKKNGVVGKLIKHRIILFSLTNQLTGTRNEYLMPNVFKDEQTLTRNQWIVNGVPVDKAPSPEELRTIASCSSPADTHTRMRWVLQGKANTCSSL